MGKSQSKSGNVQVVNIKKREDTASVYLSPQPSNNSAEEQQTGNSAASPSPPQPSSEREAAEEKTEEVTTTQHPPEEPRSEETQQQTTKEEVTTTQDPGEEPSPDSQQEATGEKPSAEENLSGEHSSELPQESTEERVTAAQSSAEEESKPEHQPEPTEETVTVTQNPEEDLTTQPEQQTTEEQITATQSSPEEPDNQEIQQQTAVEEVTVTQVTSEEPIPEVVVTQITSEEPSPEVAVTQITSEEPSPEVAVTLITSEEPSPEVTVTQITSEEPSPEVTVTQLTSAEPVPEITVTQVTSEEPSPEMAGTIETVACGVDDMTNGEMREIEIGSAKALLVKDEDKFYAIGSKCTHYGAPLAKGVYCNGLVRCPWHGACFNVKTGDIEDYPGLDSSPKFEVVIRDGKVVVRAEPAQLTSHKRTKAMVKKAADNNQTFVLVGGGPATVACAETLRQEGFTGRIVLVTKENCLPYDRIKLSKAMTVTPAEIALRNEEFYKNSDIEILQGKEVVSVDADGKTVAFQDGESLKFDSLLIATGGRPRTLPVPGLDLKNVWQLRTPEDANAIAANAKGKTVVIIGSSFIGMEVAAFLADKAQSVSVVDLIKVPFQLTLGDKVGNVLQKLHEDKGVKFYFERSIKEFVGADGQVKEAVLSDDTRLPADVCVMGVGVVPATEFLKGSSIDMTDRGYIPVNKNMQTNQSSIYAAGDIVEFPLFSLEDKQVNIQHWQMAHQHGRIAAFGMLGRPQDIRSVPYFWTVMYGKSVRYTGYGPGYDDVIVHGDLEAQKFAAFYTKGEDVVALASLAFDPIVSQAAQLMLCGQVIKKSEILDDPNSWVGRLKA